MRKGEGLVDFTGDSTFPLTSEDHDVAAILSGSSAVCTGSIIVVN